MIGSTRKMKVWAWTAPTDLRKGFGGLYEMVRHELGRDPLTGDAFLFVNRRRSSAKVLVWDGTGLANGDHEALLRHRRYLRKSVSSEVVQRIDAWCQDQRELPKSYLCDALTFLENQRTPLTGFLTDPRIPIDNNASERAIRPVVLGRKRYGLAFGGRAGCREGVLQPGWDVQAAGARSRSVHARGRGAGPPRSR